MAVSLGGLFRSLYDCARGSEVGGVFTGEDVVSESIGRVSTTVMTGLRGVHTLNHNTVT